MLLLLRCIEIHIQYRCIQLGLVVNTILKAARQIEGVAVARALILDRLDAGFVAHDGALFGLLGLGRLTLAAVFRVRHAQVRPDVDVAASGR